MVPDNEATYINGQMWSSLSYQPNDPLLQSLLCVVGVYFCFTAFGDPAVSKKQYVSVMWYVTSFEWERSGEVLWLRGGRVGKGKAGEEHAL